MKNRQFLIVILTSLFIMSAVLVSCKEDEPVAPVLVSMMAGDFDMNGVYSPTNVPVNISIVTVFSEKIDASTATSENITLTRKYDNESLAINISVSGATVTVTPQAELGTGTLYELAFSAGLKSTDGLPLTPLKRTFTTEGTFTPSGVVAHWSFENSADDVVGTYDPVLADIIDITYADSRNTTAGKAAVFNGSTSLIEIPDGNQLMSTSDFTLSFWIKVDTLGRNKAGHFVIGLAGWFGFQFEVFGDLNGCKLAAQYDLGNGSSASEDLWFPADGNLGWQGWTYCKDLSGSGGLGSLLNAKWANVVCVYNSTTKVGTMYINGEKMKSQDFNLWPDDDPKRGITGLKYAGDVNGNKLAFGWIQARANRTILDAWADYADAGATNHFQGMLDDVRIFHKALTLVEVTQMYDSENQ